MDKKKWYFAFAIAMLSFSGLVCACGDDDDEPKKSEETIEGENFFKELNGTYIELFTKEGFLSEECASTWTETAAKFVDAENVESTVQMLQGFCLGTVYGQDAIDIYKADSQSARFVCNFLGKYKKLVISAPKISGVDESGKTVFEHTYKFLEKDTVYNYYKFQAEDGSKDEFEYFFFCPDTPAETAHIEFRFGDDATALTKLTEGKYAYWLAAGVRNQEEAKKAAEIYVSENLQAMAQQ